MVLIVYLNVLNEHIKPQMQTSLQLIYVMIIIAILHARLALELHKINVSNANLLFIFLIIINVFKDVHLVIMEILHMFAKLAAHHVPIV